MHPARFVVEATKAFPKDGIMVRDGGATVIFQWTYSQAKPHDVIWNQNFGHLGTGLPYAVGASVAEGRKRPVMLLTSDSVVPVPHRRTGDRRAAKACRWSAWWVSTTSGASRSASTSARSVSRRRRPGVHWSKDVRFDKIAEGFGCYGEYVEKEEEIGPAIERAYASGKTAVVHVCIDPKANSEEMPKYDEFRTWYAEGTQ